MDHAGTISAALARDRAEMEYAVFNAQRLKEEAALDDMAELERESRALQQEGTFSNDDSKESD